jgi:glycosyltransferase involved in cell wall biosynthesis
MNILLSLMYYRPHYSGLTIYTERQARALAARGHQVTVLTSRFDPSLPAREQIDGVTIIRPWVLMRLSKGVIMPEIPLWAWRLVRQADVVNAHVPQPDAALIALVGRLLKKPVVLTYHCDLRMPNGLVHYLANQLSHLTNYISATLAERIVTNTRDYAEQSPFLRRYIDKVHPILPPIELAPVQEAELEGIPRQVWDPVQASESLAWRPAWRPKKVWNTWCRPYQRCLKGTRKRGCSLPGSMRASWVRSSTPRSWGPRSSSWAITGHSWESCPAVQWSAFFHSPR